MGRLSFLPIPFLMRSDTRFLRLGLLFLAGLFSGMRPALHAQEAAGSLITNSNMEADADGNQWPDGWPGLKAGGSWEVEANGNHFIRMTSPSPGAMVMMYSEIHIPDGVAALELKWRQRVTGLKRGAKSWFDARIMMEFMDAARGKIGPAPKPEATGRDTAGWVERSASFLVPPGAAILKFMPALFNVESGTFDLDDVTLVPVDAAPLKAAAEAAAAARAEKLAAQSAASQAKVAAKLEAGGSIISNGNFETPNKAGDFAADWAKSGTWGTDEDGNRFLRLQSTEPDKTVMSFRSITLPAGHKAFQLSLRWRITGLKPGEMPWFDARIMMDVKDAAGNKLKPQPGPLYSRSNTKDGAWIERTTSFLVPEGGVTLDLMPSLFNVKAGTFDLDDIVLTPTDAEVIIAKQKAREEIAAKARVPAETDDKSKWPPALKAKGNRLVTVDGEKEVWLQGVNVPSLEWSNTGEQVHKSVVVGIEQWKANVIRIPVSNDRWFGRKGQTDGGAAYRAIVDQMITLAANRGAYVVLDLHVYRAPKDEYLEFWTDAATRYKNHPSLIFDLMNEPHGISWEIWRNGGFVGEKTDRDEATFLTAEERAKAQGFQSPGMQKMLDTVRATGAKNMVLVGGLDYAYRLDGIVDGFGLDDPNGQGIIYACHIYPWKSGWQKYLLNAAAKYPILLGEVGADAKKMTFMPLEQQEDWETWTPAILGLIQQYKLNWTAWCFHPSASPRMLLDWDYTPTPFWGQQAKDALGGKQFPPPDRLR
jgi:endoglucanase